ncbi:4a-hydroxytetrahydrobiopterin dehydratase [Verrucomicrobia bacterium LW23]|nr:4a-hydroxytetrahydrobiopterin dehydratase [Verrucomicrobia bacterium LW23]
MTTTTSSASAEATEEVPQGWTLGPGGLRRELEFKNFAQALAFVVLAGRRAEAADHHPDVDIRWNKVTLALMTHSKGRVTAADYAMARELNGIALEDAVALAPVILAPEGIPLES